MKRRTILAVLALLLLSILSVSASAQERQTDFSKFVNWIWENVHMKMTGFDLLIVDEPVRIQSVENISDCGFSFAENGVYTLNRSINSSNTCLAINANNVTLDCQGNSIIGNGSGEGIYSNNTDNVIVKNCIITNFSTGIEFFNGMDSIMTNNTLSNNTDSGITLGSSSNSNLTDNIFSLNDGGLYFYNSSNGTFMDNRFDSNYNFGILLMEGSNYNTFSNNVLSINRSNNLNYLPNGIVISSSSYNTLDNNTFSETGIAGRQMLWIIGSSLEEFQNNVTDTNTINSLQTYYRSSRYGGCLASPVDASNYSWIGLVNCSGVDITGNLSNNLDHVLLAYTDGTNITGINVTGSLVGISVYSSKDNQFKSNFISSNLVEGFNLDFSSNNALSGNTISLNSYGIYLSASFNNTIYNNFFNQSINVHSDGFPNFWNTTKVPGTSIIHGPNIGGNFWAKPLGGFSENCTDANNDGICDDSYIINANNTDFLPLTEISPILSICKNISTPGEHIMNQSVNSNKTCFIINANNVTIDCRGNSIIGNYSGYGIYNTGGYNYTTIKNCNIMRFSISVYFDNTASHSMIENNTALDGGLELGNRTMGLGDHNTLANNTVQDVYFGIILWGSGLDNALTNNNASGGHVGIILDSASNVTLSSNTANSNIWYGIHLTNSSNNLIFNNTASSNGLAGISLLNSSSNIIYNNFFNQSINVHSDGFPNFWNTTKVPGTSIIHGPNIGGNFWAKPLGGFSENCTDANSDGICDDSYIINANNTDYLPLKALVSLTPSSPGGGGGGGGCSGTWSCTDWNSECAEGKQYRECKCSCPNAKDCKGDNATMRECSPGEIPVPAPQPITCSENWICSDWGQCESEINVDDVLSSDVINSVQFWHQRQCHDTNSCKEDKIEKVLCMQDTQIIVKKYFLDGSTVYDIFSAVNDTNLSRAAKIVLFGDKMDIYLEKPSKILKGQMPAQPPASSNIWAWTVGFMLSLAIIGISWAIRIRMLESSLKKGIGKMYSSLGRGDVKKARGEYQEMKKIYRKLPGRYQKKYYANILKLYRGLLQ